MFIQFILNILFQKPKVISYYIALSNSIMLYYYKFELKIFKIMIRKK